MEGLDVEDLEVNDIENSENDEAGEIHFTEMSFTTIDEARNYYEEYGRKKGFWIRTRTSSRGRNRNNDVTSKLFVCAKEGKHVPYTKDVDEGVMKDNEKGEVVKEKTRNFSTIKCECEAQMRIKYDKDNRKWKVTRFNDTHNHHLVSPSKRMKMRSNRRITDAVKNMAEVFHKENLKVCKVTSVFGGEHMGFGSRELYNHLRDVRHKDLDGGDAQSVLTYFKSKQAQNPQFFYAIQCDENGRATNFFWVDSRSRMSYQYFGDVISFDTTYRTNKYAMPFAPFTGVNHHWQSIQFGCALLQDETEVTFTWLFETWLEAMGGKPPGTFITDQDLAMKGAVAKVFPNTRHRLCIWHIKKKFAEKLSHVYSRKSKFKKEMKKCLWSTYKNEDFEEKWMSLMKENGLENNEWLQHMYNIRELWVPVYNRNFFFAGMNTTGRSEGVNSFFNGFVTSTTNLKEFVVKYEQAMKRIVELENDEDFESEHKFRIVEKGEFLLKYAAKVYTRNVFNKFKEEMSDVVNYRVEEKSNVDGVQTYLVTSKVNEYQKFIVTLNSMSEGVCECHTFEFIGYVCRHILKIFVRLDIDIIPDHFILARWRQKANKFRIIDSTGLVHDDENEESEALRLSHICQEATKLACFASPSKECYQIFIKSLNDLSRQFAKIREQVSSPINGNNVTNCVDLPQVLLSDPNISQTKGRNKRMQSGIELATKKKRKCRCNQVGHDWRTCPTNPNSKTNKAMEAEDDYSSDDEEET